MQEFLKLHHVCPPTNGSLRCGYCGLYPQQRVHKVLARFRFLYILESNPIAFGKYFTPLVNLVCNLEFYHGP